MSPSQSEQGGKHLSRVILELNRRLGQRANPQLERHFSTLYQFLVELHEFHDKTGHFEAFPVRSPHIAKILAGKLRPQSNRETLLVIQKRDAGPIPHPEQIARLVDRIAEVQNIPIKVDEDVVQFPHLEKRRVVVQKTGIAKEKYAPIANNRTLFDISRKGKRNPRDTTLLYRIHRYRVSVINPRAFLVLRLRLTNGVKKRKPLPSISRARPPRPS